MLDNLTSIELIRLNIDAKDWKEAVRLAAEPLVTHKKVTPSYVDAIIENVEEMGPYIVITPQVALPHARPEMGALETSLGIATLKNPVRFGNKDNDPVKYIFCLSAKENQAHLDALVDLAGLLENQEFYKILDEAKDSKEIIDFLNK